MPYSRGPVWGKAASGEQVTVSIGEQLKTIVTTVLKMAFADLHLHADKSKTGGNNA